MTSKKKYQLVILDLRQYAIIVAIQYNGRAFSKKIKIEIVNYCLFTLVLTFFIANTYKYYLSIAILVGLLYNKWYHNYLSALHFLFL